jgi:hypothetical protein
LRLAIGYWKSALNRPVIFATMTAWKKIAVAVTVLCPTIALGTGTSRAADWAPKDPPSQYSTTAGPNAVRSNTPIVDVCTTAEQLDCLESIGAYLSDKWVEGVFQNSTNLGSDNKPYSTNWKIPGLVNLNGTNDVEATLHLKYTGNVFLQSEIYAKGDKGMTDEAGLQRDVAFRVTLRTSWVLPTFISGKLLNAKISVEKLLQSGASRITMEGTPLQNMIVLDESSLTSETGKGAYETRIFGMTVADGRFYPVKSECRTQPTLMISDNSYGHPLPKFEQGNLDLRVSAPHFKPDGKTLYRGIYEASIPLATAKCLWDKDIDLTSRFQIQVLEAGADSGDITQSISIDDKEVRIKASGFTFSSPTVRVTYLGSTSELSSLPSAISKVPAKPTGLAVSINKRTLKVTFKKVTNVSYVVTATKGTTKKTLRCTSVKTQMKCQFSNAAKGTWKITVTPKNALKTGASASRAVKVSS